MVQRKISPLLHLAFLTALTTVTLPVPPAWSPPANAQLSDAAAFPMPTTVPKGTTVRIDGANSMVAINQALKQKFEGKFVGTSVNIATNGIEPALQALLDDKLDLLAIGRPLTPEEKSKGLTATPAVRDKIAILVGPNNPFKGSLTIHQFAKIFRGEITDWSEVGGPPGRIRLIDRPETSDTRQAFQNYPVFKSAPFQAVATATQVPDKTAAVIEQLGTDGISYATANQVKDVTAVRILNMHKVLPDDPRYPFSQPLLYVYKGAPSPAVQSFIGYATAPEGRAAIAQARAVEAAAIAAAIPAAVASASATPAGTAPSPGTASSPSGATPAAGSTPAAGASPGAASSSDPVVLLSPSAAPAILPSTNDYNGAAGWLWGLLPLGLAGAWLLLRRKGAGPAVPEADVPPLTPPPVSPVSESLPLPAAPDSDISSVATPAPTVPEASSAAGWALGGAALAAGAGAAAIGASATSDAEPINEPAIAPPQPPTPLPDPWDETPAIAPLGLGAAAGVVAAGAAAASVAPEPEASAVEAPTVEAPDLGTPAVATPEAATLGVTATAAEIPAAEIPAVDVPAVETPDADGLNLAAAAAAGIATAGVAAAMASSASEAPDSASLETGILDGMDTPEAPTPKTPDPEGDFNLSGVAAALGGVAAVGLGAVAATAFNQESQTEVEATRFSAVPGPSDLPPANADLIDANLASVDANLPDLPDGYGDSRIVLLPRDPQWGYAYWDTPNEHKEELRRQGGQTIALRIYDVTDGDIPGQAPQNLQQYDCGELARDWHVPIPFSDRDYVAEIGYLTADGRWLSLAKSLPIRIPPMFPSDWFDDQFLTLDWQEDLRGRTFMQLMPGRSGGFNNPIYDHIFGLSKTADAQRVAGSLFGSMQHVAGSVPAGSAQMLGSSERMIGASEQMVGGSERMIGASERMIGASERMMGGSESVSSFSLAARMPGFSVPTMSGVGMNMSGIGMNMSGVGMSGIGMNVPGVGMSGIGMNMSGVGFAVPTMSGIGMSGIGFFSSMPPVRARKFWLIAEAELIVYGATEPDATVYIGGQPIALNPDGTFRFHIPFPEGQVDFPILAIAANGVQTRSIHMNFNRATPERRTNTKDEAIEESY